MYVHKNGVCCVYVNPGLFIIDPGCLLYWIIRSQHTISLLVNHDPCNYSKSLPWNTHSIDTNWIDTFCNTFALSSLIWSSRSEVSAPITVLLSITTVTYEYGWLSQGGHHARIQVFFGGDRTPPPLLLSAIFFCLLICPGPCNNLDPLLKFLYEPPPPPSECTKPSLLNPGSAPGHSHDRWRCSLLTLTARGQRCREEGEMALSKQSWSFPLQRNITSAVGEWRNGCGGLWVYPMTQSMKSTHMKSVPFKPSVVRLGLIGAYI